MKNKTKSDYIKELFNSVSSRYDKINAIMTLGRDRMWRRFTVQHSGIKLGGSALDVCCGSGKLAIELAGAVSETGLVIGIDFS